MYPRRGAVGDQELVNASLAQAPRCRLARVSRPDDQNRTGVEIADDALGEPDGHRAWRKGSAADVGLGPRSLSNLDCQRKQSPEHGPDRLRQASCLERCADLAQNLILAQNHRVETGGDPEKIA